MQQICRRILPQRVSIGPADWPEGWSCSTFLFRRQDSSQNIDFQSSRRILGAFLRPPMSETKRVIKSESFLAGIRPPLSVFRSPSPPARAARQKTRFAVERGSDCDPAGSRRLLRRHSWCMWAFLRRSVVVLPEFSPVYILRRVLSDLACIFVTLFLLPNIPAKRSFKPPKPRPRPARPL